MKTAIETDPLDDVLAQHIWYTTRTRGSAPAVICYCYAVLKDSTEHTKHVRSVVRKFLESE